MDEEGRRPLDQADFERAYAVTTALRCKVILGDNRDFFKILRELHRNKLGRQAHELVDDIAADHEIKHAFAVLEALIYGERTIRKNVEPG
jgi:hypothetical protein